MIVTYFRSSSYNTHDSCPMSYFIEYGLGWRGASNIKADKGTITHKVLEIMAMAKEAQQNGQDTFVDDIIGETSSLYYDINAVSDQVYDYYSKAFAHHKWSDKDRKDCLAWTWKAITLNNGAFDPRKRKVVKPELRFDFEIDKPWAKYDYTFDGQKLSGQLALKGTIDLITDISDNNSFYEVVDWKTGKRINWATGEEKTQEKLQDDPQLRMYHYALSHVFPEVQQIMVTIFFINDGGPFSICFGPDDIAVTEEMLKKKFELIKQTKIPRLHKSWKCSKLCGAGKTTFEGTQITPLKEGRSGQVTPKGKIMSKCEQTLYTIQTQGIDKVTKDLACPGHSIGHYQSPGST